MLRYLYHTMFYKIFNDTFAGHYGSLQKQIAKGYILKQQGANCHMVSFSIGK